MIWMKPDMRKSCEGRGMKTPQSPLRKKRLSPFYGWIIVAASFAAMMVHGFFFSFGVFYKPLMDDFGWTAAEVSLASSISSVTYILSVVLVSFVYKRSVRLVILLGGLLMGTSLALSSQVTELWQLYLFYGVLGGVGTSTIWVPFTATLMKWFTKKRGVAMGIALSGGGLGSLCAAPLLTYTIITYGWRTAFFVAGVATFLIMLSVGLVMRGDPEEMGLKPYGEEQEKKRSPNADQDLGKTFRSFTAREAIRKKEFWMLYVLWVFSMVMSSIYNQHIVLFAITIGISSIVASIALGTIGFSSILGRLTVGFLLDRISVKRALIFCFLTNMASAVLLTLATNELSLYLFAMIFGFSMGGRITLEVPLASGFFGLTNLGGVLGVLETAFGIGGFVGPYLAGYMFDRTGRYHELFLSCALLSVGLFLLTIRFKSIGATRRN